MITKRILYLLTCTLIPSVAQLLINGEISNIDSSRIFNYKKRQHLRFNLEYEQDSYFATTLNIGNPSQNITVLFDTGSADTWLMDSKNLFCQQNYKDGATYDGTAISGNVIDCSAIEMYDTSLSSSLILNNDNRFYIQYEDKSFADGKWATETFNFNGTAISNVTFGLANFATTPLGGVFGIGFERRESVTGYDGAPNSYYKNFPQVLKDEGIINTVAYSLSLGNDESSILFGAVDKNGYIGDLVTFPMINMYPTAIDKPATLSLTIQGVGAKNNNECNFETFMTTKFPVLLDSGSTIISAPTSVADKMANFIGASWSDEDGIYTMNCPSENQLSDIVYVFDFGDIKIDINLSDLILPPQDDSDICAFGILRSDKEFILGDSFLKSTYVVFDLENYLISMGKANNDIRTYSNPDFMDIKKGGSIPGAKKARAIPWTTYDSASSIVADLFSKEKKKCSIQNVKTRDPLLTNIAHKDVHLITKTEVVSKTEYSTIKICNTDN